MSSSSPPLRLSAGDLPPHGKLHMLTLSEPSSTHEPLPEGCDEFSGDSGDTDSEAEELEGPTANIQEGRPTEPVTRFGADDVFDISTQRVLTMLDLPHSDEFMMDDESSDSDDDPKDGINVPQPCSGQYRFTPA